MRMALQQSQCPLGGLGPLAIGAIAATYSFEVAIALLASFYLVDMVALWLLIPDRGIRTRINIPNHSCLAALASGFEGSRVSAPTGTGQP